MKDFPLQSFYGDIHSTYDRVNRIFTFGQDKVWRSKAVAELLGRQPHSVLDLCTGTGDFILETARKAEKGAELKGLDFSPAMLEIAREKYHRLSGHETVVPVEFLEGDAGKMPFSEASSMPWESPSGSGTWCMRIPMPGSAPGRDVPGAGQGRPAGGA
jgi:demethylmenaquinone methyltransferase/2-methoxy-6-polyprenyl-1,4-benzoquinol methylase